MSADALRQTAESVYRQMSCWTIEEWSAPTANGMSRAEVVHDLIQRIADVDARIEDLPQRSVPRLDNDLVLGDQFRVVVADCIAVAHSVDSIKEVQDAFDEARHLLT